MSEITNPQLLMRWRMLKDRLAHHTVSIGGISVIIAVVLIFFYLTYVVLPMFKPAEINHIAAYSLPEQDATLAVTLEEQATMGMQILSDGRLRFFRTTDGSLVHFQSLPLPEGSKIASLAQADPASGIFALGLTNGQALVFKQGYRVSYPGDKRTLTPFVEYPLGEKPVVVDEQGLPLLKLAVQADEEQATLAAETPDERILLLHMAPEESLFADEPTWNSTRFTVPHPGTAVYQFLLDKQQRDLFMVSQGGELSFYDIADWDEGPNLVQHLPLLRGQGELTDISFLAGDISLLVASSSGRISQWFPVKDNNGKRVLTHIRDFSGMHGRITAIMPESQRKGFVAVDNQGEVGIFHSTAHRTLLVENVTKGKALEQGAINSRGDAILLLSKSKAYFYHIDNEYPEISWSALWGKVWYESYPEPEYVWQSSSASNDFEPKLSLVPISFGTLKAAFYAMLVAMPLAIMGAIFTANFMSSRLRQVVKPTIEIMEALPTVILGFLAGLWLAPYIENHLPGIFSVFLLMPFGLLFAAWSWRMLPDRFRHRVPDGWEPLLLAPVVVLLVWGCMEVSPWIEANLFNGDIRIWLKQALGVDYDQRNSIIIGLAMGFAVIPTIFSISEDAIFAVPKHLIQGSLALGATPWQTLVRVVLLTASPGIFSAVMIGMGRAVGETMIVLMATGNTPVMDFSVFQGMRTLSANIAVEMPEAEVGSTHYRVLFLAALVLFGFTFIVNTVAELVRQRLRKRYSSL
jgi:phosphate transport system permease protein